MDLYIHIKYDFLKSKIVSSDAKIIYSLIDNFYQEQIDCEKIAKILTWDYNCVVNCLSELERCNLLKINNNGILAVKGFSNE